MDNVELVDFTKDQTREAFSYARNIIEDLPVPQDTEMVQVISLVAKEHQEYVTKKYASVAVEIDGKKFMLRPKQLVPKRAKVLTSKVRASDDGKGNKKPVPVGFGIVSGGQQ
jgi:hypothetical protein